MVKPSLRNEQIEIVSAKATYLLEARGHLMKRNYFPRESLETDDEGTPNEQEVL